jgi:pyridoxal phosphate enzyme (YggS family)
MRFSDLPERLREVSGRIDAAVQRGGHGQRVTIVAVTKTHGPEAVRAALAAGLHCVGENRVQEALQKQAALPDVPVEWHLIGTLQRNKARHAVGRFALIHSIDRADLAAELERRVPAGSSQQVLIQVNCSGEAQKGGVAPESLPDLLQQLATLDRIQVQGLMTMSALTADSSGQRQAFRLLRELRESAQQAGHALPELSMGMSGDYAVAVEEGATMIRLGTVLFGERTT